MTTSSQTKQWRDAFITELRLRGASGRQIGDELALVESHCLDAGAEVDEAFGDPVDYARSVVITGDGAALSAGEGRSILLRTLVQATGLMILLEAVFALVGERQATFTGVELVMAIVLAALLVLLVSHADAVMRFVTVRSVVAVAATGVALAVLLVIVALFAAPFVATSVLTFSLIAPAGLAAAVGGLMLVLPSVFQASLQDDDVIVEPLSDAPALSVRRWPGVLLRWWVPATGLALCALVLVLG